MMTNAVQIHRHGGPKVLTFEPIVVAPPGPGQVLVKQSAIGVNYADIYQREGEAGPHDAQPMPIVLGGQSAGLVEQIGPGVTGFAVGDRVVAISPGAYAERRLIPADRLLALPPDISDGVAASALLRGMTAEYLLRRLFRVKAGHTVLIHAAAGGMGLLLGQWAKALGARTIGTVGADAKVTTAKASGYDEVIVTEHQGFADAVLSLTDGIGVDVVYDGVGRAAFLPSLNCVRPMGMVISYGTASGNVGAFDLQLLHKKSIIVTRPTLRTWIAKRDDYETAAAAVFAALRAGVLRGDPARSYPLRDARQAHQDLQSRQMMGTSILIP